MNTKRTTLVLAALPLRTGRVATVAASLLCLVTLLATAFTARPAPAQVLLVASDQTHAVSRYDAVTGAPLNVPFFAIPGVSYNPVLYDGNNRVFVGSSAGVSVFNATTGASINAAFISVQGQAIAMALDRSNHLFIDTTFTVGVYNATTGAPLNANLISLHGYLTAGLAVDDNNNLFLSDWSERLVSKFNATTGASINPSFITADDPWDVVLDGHNHMFVALNGANNGVGEYDATTGAVLNTVVRYTYFFSNAFGQGNANMLITPTGYGGNYFNAWWRNAHQVELLPMVQLPAKSWHGSHELKFGVDVLNRSYSSRNVSDPIEIRALDGSTVLETITFQPAAGRLHAADTEVSEYAEDQWNLASGLSLNFGARSTTQSTSRRFAFAPRGGLAYSLPGGKTVVRGGAGLIFGHVPLLASDLGDTQTRTVAFSAFAGPYANQKFTLQNTYLPAGMNSAGADDPGNSPRTVTWNVALESELRRNLSVRLTYYETHTTDLFIVNPILPAPGTNGSGMLAMQNTGTANYRQAQISARYRPGERAEVNVSYAWSQARGDLNSLSDTFIPFAAPVLHPNLYEPPNWVLTLENVVDAFVPTA